MSDAQPPKLESMSIQGLLALSHDILRGKDIGEILDGLPGLIRSAIPSKGCVLSLLDEETRTLHVYETDGMLTDETQPRNVKVGEDFLGLIASRREARMLNRATSEKNVTRFIPAHGKRAESLLGAPVLCKDKLYGALMLVDSENGAFTLHDVDTLQLFCEIIATAFQNMDQAEADRERERLARVGGALAEILHDIKNPLTAARGFADLLSKQDGKNGMFARQVLLNIDNLLAMLQDCLDYSRGHAIVNKQPVNANEYLGKFTASIAPLLELNAITLDTDFQTDLTVPLDPAKFSRALYNLATNSIKFMRADQRELSLRSRTLGGGIQIEFSDTGAGIARENQKKLFSPYFSTDQVTGTGLGLVSVKSIIDAHGGAINFCSFKDQGTTFQITLPLAPNTGPDNAKDSST